MDKKEQITPCYDLVPSKLGWSMKVIGKTGSVNQHLYLHL